VQPSPVLRAVLAAALLVLGQGAAHAQAPPPKGPPPVTKAAPRLPPNASQTSRIPAGVDSGTSATSDTMELGTPVPPALGGDRSEMTTRSAAARAAARPKPAASSPDCAPRNGTATMGKTAAPPAKGPVGAASGATVARGSLPAC
jgi:hypothetical protein